VIVWDLSKESVVRTLNLKEIICIEFSKEGKYIAIGSDKTLIIWDWFNELIYE